MRRREVIAFATVAAWSIAAHAQQRATPVVGFLSGASLETMRDWVAAFHLGLAEAGFADGRNVVIDYRWAEGNNDRLPGLAEDLVRRKVDIIAVVASTPGALAAKAATGVIPIIFFIGTDPVKVGLVASLAQPGGNVTGVTALVVELFVKTLELMHNVMPPGTTIAASLTQPTFPRLRPK
jgi:putative ABC transport system substrate-binding protein